MQTFFFLDVPDWVQGERPVMCLNHLGSNAHLHVIPIKTILLFLGESSFKYV